MISRCTSARRIGPRFRGFQMGGCYLLATILVAIAGFAGAAEQVMIDGVPHIKNGTTPSQGIETHRLRELWRVGADDEDEFFGLLTRVVGDQEGNVYALDSQLCQVSVYSPDGERLRVLFREGEGPGEVRDPRDLLILDDGRVGLIREFPGVIVFVDRQGDPAGKLVLGGDDPDAGGFCSLTACASSGNHFILTGTITGPGDGPGIQNRINYLSRYSIEGKETVRYEQAQTTYNFNDFLFAETHHMPNFWWNSTVDQDGRVYTAPSDDYAINVYLPDGTLEKVIERDFQSWKRDEIELAKLRGMIETALVSVQIPNKTIEIEDHAADIAYLQRGIRIRNGELWVMSARSIRDQPTGTLVTFDVFDRDGDFTKQVALQGPGSSFRDGIFFTGEDRVVVVKGYLESLAAQFGNGATFTGEDEEPELAEIICYVIEQ